jgi:small subunit ribosomal protein S14
MAKKSMIAREKKRATLVAKYATTRRELKMKMRATPSVRVQFDLHLELQKLPRDSSATRLHNRCMQTGRPHAFYRDFGLSRHNLREMAHKGLLPGVTKASW